MSVRIVTLVVVGVIVGLVSPVGAQVSGEVVEMGTSSPIPGAIVTLQATAIRALTDADGLFVLPGATGVDLVIVGARKGYYNASVVVTTPASGVQIVLEPVPQDDDPGYELVEPDSCGVCHPNQLAEWTGSPMSKGGLNTWVYDIYDGTGTPGGMGGFVYTRDSVHAEANPASECAACHQPESWIAEEGTPLVDLDPVPPPGALHGISCDTCHKIADVDVNQINYPGIIAGPVTFTRPALPGSTQVQYGVLGDADFLLASQMRASYNPQLVAETCGTCHQDKNDPDLDGDFEEPNGVISEPTYLEWADSPYSDPQSPLYASCVDCHMPPSGETQVCNLIDLVRDPDTIRSHNVEGTTPFYLENAVELTMQVTQTPGQLQVDAEIYNHGTGHHVPTGVTIRNMILLVQVIREEDGLELLQTGGEIVHDLGGIGNPDEGYYAGQPGKYFSKVNHDQNGVGPTFFTDATGIQFDNRIPPLGTDSSSYTFAVPSNGGTLNVRARLIYRRSFRFLTDAKGWEYDGHGNVLADVTPPHYGHLMEEAEDSVVLPFTPSTFLRGDTNGDGALGLVDALGLLDHLFTGGDALLCPDSGDSNDDGSLGLVDGIHLLSYLFVPGSPEPPAPGPSTCGEDPTADALEACGDSFCL